MVMSLKHRKEGSRKLNKYMKITFIKQESRKMHPIEPGSPIKMLRYN